MKPLPDRLNLRRADLAISADQRHAQSDSRSRHNSIRKIRHFVAAHKFKRICDGAVERRKAARCCRIVERVHQPFPCRRRNPALLDQIGQLNQADRRNMNHFAVGGCPVECRGSPGGKTSIARQIPDDGVRIDGDRRHQISSLGKFVHISRWFSSISSAESEIPRSAQRPLMLLKGFLGAVSSRRRVAWINISCCLSAGNARTASRMACSTDMVDLFHIIPPSLANAKEEAVW